MRKPLDEREGVDSSAVCLAILFRKDGVATSAADCVVSCASLVEEPQDEREWVESSAGCLPAQSRKDGVATSEADCVVGCASQVEDPLDERGAEDGLALVLEM